MIMRFVPIVAVGLALDLSMAFVLAQAVPAQPALAQRHYQDFRAGRFDEAQLMYLDDGAEYIKREPEGLRIALPANKPDMPPTGFAWQNTIAGDFEITVTYQVLEAEAPKSGKPSDIVIFVPFESEEPREWVAISRSVCPWGDEVAAFHGMNNANGPHVVATNGQWKLMRHPFPASERAGKLRLRRTGSTVFYLAAKNQSDDFRELHKEPCSTGDVLWVRVYLENGGALTPYSARIVDFQVNAGEHKAPPPDDRRRSAGRFWTLLLAIALLSALSLGLWFALRRKRARTLL